VIAENISPRPCVDEGAGQLIAALQHIRDDAAKVGIAWHELADDSEDIKDAILEAMKQ
jgi:hypothetical protein